MSKVYAVTLCCDGNVKVEKLFLYKSDATDYLALRYQSELIAAKEWVRQTGGQEKDIVCVDGETCKTISYDGSWTSLTLDTLDGPF